MSGVSGEQSTWPNIDRPLCDHCGYPLAVQEDYDRYNEGEGEHLCWGDPWVCQERQGEPMNDPSSATPDDIERIARRFHETYEQLAPSLGYRTRTDSAVPWDDVPTKNKTLMRQVVAILLVEGAIKP